MKLEEKVCSLELAKELKKLGVKQDSLWYWIEIKNEWLIISQDDIKEYSNMFNYISENYSAFTVAELGIYFKDINRKKLERKLASSDKFWIEWELQKDKIIMDLNFLVEILIYLIKNKIINIDRSN